MHKVLEGLMLPISPTSASLFRDSIHFVCQGCPCNTNPLLPLEGTHVSLWGAWLRFEDSCLAAIYLSLQGLRIPSTP